MPIIRTILLTIVFMIVTPSWGDMSWKNLYNISVLNMKAGLPHNYVSDIFEDSRGFLWVATQGGGLVRYDGYGFMGPGVSDRRNIMRSNSCRNVVEDKFHRLWVAFDEGVDVLNLTTYQREVPQGMKKELSRLMDESAKRVYRDTKDNIWIVTVDHLYRLRFDAGGNVVQILGLPCVNSASDIAIDDVEGNGTVWASVDGGLWAVGEEHGRLVKRSISAQLDVFKGAYLTGICRHGGYVWFSSNIGLYRYDRRNHQLKAYHHTMDLHSLSHDYTTCLTEDERGRLLVGSLYGVNVYRPATDDFEVWQDDDDNKSGRVSTDFIHCIHCSSGIVWIGTENNGITTLSTRQLIMENFVHSPQDPRSITPGCVNSIYMEHGGTLWVGTVDGGLNRKAAGDSGFRHYTTANSSLSHNTVSTLADDKYRRLWIGTWGGGVCHIDMDHPDRIERLHVDAGHERLIDYIGALAYDAYNDGLWIGSNDGLFFYDFKRAQLQMPFKECRQMRGCIGTLIDAGHLWVGCLSGLRIIDLKSRRNGQGYFRYEAYVFKLDHPESKIVDKLTSFCLSRDGSVWIGSNGYGLYRATATPDHHWHFKAYTVLDGLANNGVKGISEDSNGHLWITTNSGLSVMNPKEGAFTTFNCEDGLLSDQFYWNSSVAADGDIYLGTDRGLIRVDDLNVQRARSAHVCFTALQVDNVDVFSGSRYIDSDISSARKLVLSEGDKSFSISFSTLRFSIDNKGIYSYRMKGFESDWIQTHPGEHTVRYTNLPPGNYTFEVKYMSALTGRQNLRVTSIEVEVVPYFYKSWWFITLAGLLVLAGGVYYYRRRIEQLKVREANRLLEPIKDVLKHAENPEELQSRISKIIDNQERYRNSYTRSAETARQEEMEKHAVHEPLMDRLTRVMETHYGNSEFDSKELADAMGVSRRKLAELVKAETGQTPSQFIKEYRMNIAMEMLKEAGDMNIADIAFSVGFNDPKYFTRCFTKFYGKTPSYYLKGEPRE